MTNRLLPLLLLPACLTSLAAQRPPRAPVAPAPPRVAPAPWPEPLLDLRGTLDALRDRFVLEPPLLDWDGHGLLDGPVVWDPPLPFEPPEVEPLLHWDPPAWEPLLWDAPDPPDAPGPLAHWDLPVLSPAPGLWEAPHPTAQLAVPGFARQAPDDSLYREARALLNRGEYRRAAELFQEYERKNPTSRYAAAAMYWRAFALYRAGTDADLRQALATLDEQRQRFKEAASDEDVAALVTRVAGALARRGDADAARRLREGAAQGAESCDREDMDVRAEALSALVQSDPEGSADLLRRTLARRDPCAAPLRRRAVYLLGRQGDAGSASVLLDVARSDPDARVRSDAVSRLAQLPGASSLPLLEQLFNQSTDEALRRSVVQSLHRLEGADAGGFLRRVIEREDLPDDVRADAVRALGRSTRAVTVASAPVPDGDRIRIVDRARVMLRGQAPETGLSETDAAFLRGVYGRTTSRTIRNAVLETLARSGGAANDQWLMGIVRDPAQDLRYRTAALSRLRRADVPIAELGRLYDTLTERDLRGGIVSILGAREEDAATDKLIEIARTGTDPSIRRAAISALSRKKDPRTTRLLLELVER